MSINKHLVSVPSIDEKPPDYKKKENGGFPNSSADKASACNARDPSSILGSGKSTGETIGYPLSIFGLPW